MKNNRRCICLILVFLLFVCVPKGAFATGITDDNGVIGDFDGDGYDDVLWQYQGDVQSPGLTYVWYMNGCTYESVKHSDGGNHLWDIKKVGDFDGDGLDDVLFMNVYGPENGNTTSGRVSAWYMDAGRTMYGHTAVILSTLTDLTYEAKIITDFDNNGTQDILWWSPSNNTMMIWAMDTTRGTFVEHTYTKDTPAIDIKFLGDFDNDGFADDILMRDRDTGDMYFWFMDDRDAGGVIVGPNGFDKNTTPCVEALPLEWEIKNVGNFDDVDGTDIIFKRISDGYTSLWNVNGCTHTACSINPGGALYPEWTITKVGNLYDEDSVGDPLPPYRDEVLWRNRTVGHAMEGDVYTWTMDGCTKDPCYFNTVTLDWVEDKIGDFDNDSMMDILWRNTITGYTYLWTMNACSDYVPCSWDGPNTDWVVVPSIDFDKDTLPDWWERKYFNNSTATTNDPNGDQDSDGLTNISEYRIGTDPDDTDTDDDGMPDGWEVDYTLDPLTDDSGDDLDEDGLTNLEEYTKGTLPNDEDTDDDGMTDGWEDDYTLDPLDPNDADQDADGDIVYNYIEFKLQTNPINPNDIPVTIITYSYDSKGQAIQSVSVAGNNQ